ncbi:MAG: hypothetical protein JRI23_27700 [Deltaproteobacteria bacterium]|jgi:hypothetical protein|nr:hypothetical protein [Deltaproteobacteria bacterium]MBW2535866.1 hypothetical protein [Deltaproteobacteria bacterium]
MARRQPRRSARPGAWLAAALLALCACKEGSEPNTADDVDDPCGPKADLERAGKTTGEAAKTGATTAVEGVKTFGKSVGGFFSGGADEAEEEWKEGSKKTKQTAREGADDTEAAARDDRCPTD